MYRYAGPDQESRDAAEEATRLMSECTAQLAIRQDLFLLVRAVYDKRDLPNEECVKAVRGMLREFTNVGHEKLSPDQIEMLLDSRKEISQLCQEFNRNLRESTEGAWFMPAELEGLSMQDIQRLTEKTKDQVYIDYGKRADRLLVLRHARNPATWKKLFLGNKQRLSENIALFKRVVLLRHDNARMLGFKSHAELKLQERIATSTDWVDGMLNSMCEQLLPVGKGVMEQLKPLKKMHLATKIQPEDDEILPWDFHYYMRLLEDVASEAKQADKIIGSMLIEASAQIFAAELYETALATNPQSQQTWDRYRNVILEPGGSSDGLKMMEKFLGHKPTPDALVRSLRL